MIGDARRAACVAIGDELIAGEYADSNSGAVAQRLAELGIQVERFVVVGDDAAALEKLFYELCRDYQIVVASGGLGPTLDDVTREAAAAAAGVALVRDDATLAWLREMFASRKREMSPANERQAWFPQGAQIMPNQCGTAPGFRVWIDGGMLAVLPGPPREMHDMLERELLPWIISTCGRGPAVAVQRFFLIGLPESAFADRVGDWMSRSANPLIGVTAHQGMLKVTLRARGASEEGAQAVLAARSVEFRARFAAEIFSETDHRPAFAVGRALIERGITLATAESCTGGLLAQMLTDVPGISAVFREGWITYANEAKERSLGVPRALLDKHGAVSREVAEAMALGAARVSGSRMAVAITGVAGPDGGTPAKPVGLVWLGLSLDGKSESVEQRYLAVNDRASIRAFAANAALDLVRRRMPAR